MDYPAQRGWKFRFQITSLELKVEGKFNYLKVMGNLDYVLNRAKSSHQLHFLPPSFILLALTSMKVEDKMFFTLYLRTKRTYLRLQACDGSFSCAFEIAANFKRAV
ncbi:hypothetical protein AVEN_266341-1 [Araneus ventricosus]|uniref:Uncharacterized protein n=1 Tax=Araneus ventricosus TaxID=182803 RepID=A0A4Y2CPL8_ARAVE|nr:hypothetical protein AVEN_266341-1 [Araneus ventricosus]